MTIALKRQILLSLVAGLAISGVLFALNSLIDLDRHAALRAVLFTAQYPGWIACAFLLPGSLETTSTMTYIGITVPVNAILYGAVVLVVLRMFGRVAPFG